MHIASVAVLYFLPLKGLHVLAAHLMLPGTDARAVLQGSFLVFLLIYYITLCVGISAPPCNSSLYTGNYCV